MKSTILILTLQNIPKIGNKGIQKILSLAYSENINHAKEIMQLIKKAKQNYNPLVVPPIEAIESSLYEANRIYEESIALDIHIISILDKKYPELLKQIENPPLLLHTKGNFEVLNNKCIALVGTRKPTEYGLKNAESLGFQFAKHGLNVVSGLALGVDTSAHKGALKADGITIAVLAHGLDAISPKSNKKLAKEIISNNGLLLSEYPIGAKVKKHTYIERNRIQSGLSLGTVLIESKRKGGSMKTAEFCKKQNRLLGVVKPHEGLIDDEKYQGNKHLMSDPNTEVIDGNGEQFSKKIIDTKKKIFCDYTLDSFL